MKNLIEKMDKYILKNELPTYYRVKKDLTVDIKEPSFVFELLFFGEDKMADSMSKDCVLLKPKKLKDKLN